jgi:trehalose 6-phosphate phosphatase
VRLQTAPLVALFLDFDGTLARLRPRPEEVWMESSARQALTDLVRIPRLRIWVISGRRQADVRARIRVPGIRYLGLHGWEGRAHAALSEDTRRSLSCVASWLGGLVADTPGIWIEDKEHALTVHYRGVPRPDARRARLMLDGVVAPFRCSLRIHPGKSIWEVVPREVEDKGAAVRELMAPLRGRALPLYVGDDRMDESAFAALPGGVTVRVGSNGLSHAQYRLSGASEVCNFLHKLRREFE